MDSTNFKPLDGEGSFNYCAYSIYFTSGHVHRHHVLIQAQITDGMKEIAGPDYSYVLSGYEPVYLDENERQQVINVGLIKDGAALLKRLKEHHYKKTKCQVG